MHELTKISRINQKIDSFDWDGGGFHRKVSKLKFPVFFSKYIKENEEEKKKPELDPDDGKSRQIEQEREGEAKE